jgi:hypothetical protein
VGGSHGRLPLHPLAESDAQEVKRTGRWTWRPERVVVVVVVADSGHGVMDLASFFTYNLIYISSNNNY